MHKWTLLRISQGQSNTTVSRALASKPGLILRTTSDPLAYQEWFLSKWTKVNTEHSRLWLPNQKQTNLKKIAPKNLIWLWFPALHDLPPEEINRIYGSIITNKKGDEEWLRIRIFTIYFEGSSDRSFLCCVFKIILLI